MKKYLERIILASLLVTGFGIFTRPAHAVSEIHYQDEMKQQVWPFYATGVDGSFRGEDGVNIHFRKWENPNEIGAIVIFPGRADPFLTYAETIYDLAQKGYSIYALDHRGQGASDRILSNPELGYVNHFDDYITDAKTFVDTVVDAKPHAKKFLIAHSMGGAIAALYSYHFPQDFTAMALVAPMFEINTSPYKEWEAKLLAWFNVFTGKGTEYAPTQHDFDVNETFEANRHTQSRVRWQTYHETFIDNPPLREGGATNLWVKESLAAGDQIHSVAEQIETPTLLLTAGLDSYVDAPAQQYFCQHARRCSAVPVYPDSLHDILNERDSIRDDAFSQILQFFSEY